LIRRCELVTQNDTRHVRRANSQLRRYWILMISVLVCVSLFASSCGLHFSSDETAVKIEVSEDTLDIHSLVQLIITGISDPDKIDAVYGQIPESQMNNISLATFREYIAVLARMLPSDLSELTFRVLDDASRSSVLTSLAVGNEAESELISVTVPVEIYLTKDYSSETPLYLYLQEDANKTPYLSSLWVSECLSLYNYSILYFYALEGQNYDAVASMIKQSQSDESELFSDQVYEYKAKQLSKFYKIQVKSQYDEYKVGSLNVGQITYIQPEVLDSALSNYSERTVIFARDTDDQIQINDSVSMLLSANEFTLYRGDEKMIRVGDRADSNQFATLFGNPILFMLPDSDRDTEEVYGSDGDIIITYSQFSVTISGTLYSDGSWDGEITRIRLFSENKEYSFGRTIDTSMSRDDLLMLYPFADLDNYIVSAIFDDQRYNMSFSFADDERKTITGVKLQLVE